MDIKQMRYFMEICKLGSVSQAAKSLFISQQGLSSSMNRLEQELGCDLFYRKGNALILTEHGQFFLYKATEIVNSSDKLQNHFRNMGQESSKEITIICAYSILSKAPEALQQVVIDVHDDITVSTGECYTDECQTYLENNNCDFVICYDQDWSAKFEKYYLFNVEHCFVVHESHPLAQSSSITFDQLDGVRMIYPEKKTVIREKFDNLIKQYKIHPHVVMETNQALQIASLIARDHSLVARLTLSDAMAINAPGLKILSVADVDFYTRAVLLHRADVTLSPAAATFKNMLLETIK